MAVAVVPVAAALTGLADAARGVSVAAVVVAADAAAVSTARPQKVAAAVLVIIDRGARAPARRSLSRASSTLSSACIAMRGVRKRSRTGSWSSAPSTGPLTSSAPTPSQDFPGGAGNRPFVTVALGATRPEPGSADMVRTSSGSAPSRPPAGRAAPATEATSWAMGQEVAFGHGRCHSPGSGRRRDRAREARKAIASGYPMLWRWRWTSGMHSIHDRSP